RPSLKHAHSSEHTRSSLTIQEIGIVCASGMAWMPSGHVSFCCLVAEVNCRRSIAGELTLTSVSGLRLRHTTIFSTVLRTVYQECDRLAGLRRALANYPHKLPSRRSVG